MTAMKKTSISPQSGKQVPRGFKYCVVVGCFVLFAFFALRFDTGFNQATDNVAVRSTGATTIASSSQPRTTENKSPTSGAPPQQSKDQTPIRLAFVGNSLLYYNDSPGMLAAMIESTGRTVEYDACMRGGASFSSLPQKGCSGNLQISRGRLDVFSLIERQWDFIIFQDQSKAPANPPTRNLHANLLRRTYIEGILKSGATPLFLQTAGYKNPRDKYELMTRDLRDGYHAYADAVKEALLEKDPSSTNRIPRVSPVGEAYLRVFQTNQQLWKQLYMDDGLHPTPKATWMQACVLYVSILNEEPPHYDPAFWDTATHGFNTGLELPTLEEAKELREIAMEVTGVGKQGALTGRL